MNESGETFLATMNIQPPTELHPVEELLYHLKMLLLSGLAIDRKFALHTVFPALNTELPPLTSVDRDFPSTAKEVIHYAHVARGWQLVKVHPGQKDNNGKQKKQPNIYVVVSIFSSFDRQVIMRYLLPELDVLGMRLSIKGVQIADTETTMVFLGVHPETCPEGFKALVRKVLLLEADAMVKRKELSAIDRGTLELDDMFFKSQGIKSTRLSNPSDQARYGTEAFVDSLNRGIVMETPVGRTSSYRALLDAAVTSGLTKKYLGSRATPREIPQGNISQHNSRVWMKLKRAHMGLIFHSDVCYLDGVIDPFMDVRTAWQEGWREKSSFQHKTINLFKVIMGLKTECGQPVFYASCPVVLGSHAGSLMCTSYKREPVLTFRDKILRAPIPWLYWYCYCTLGIHPSCID